MYSNMKNVQDTVLIVQQYPFILKELGDVPLYDCWHAPRQLYFYCLLHSTGGRLPKNHTHMRPG